MLKQFWASFIRTLWRAVWKGLHSALAGRYAGEEGIAGRFVFSQRVRPSPEQELHTLNGRVFGEGFGGWSAVGVTSIFYFMYSDCLIF